MSSAFRKPPAPEPAAPAALYASAAGPSTWRRLAPGLHIVATPIGNLGDITLRALETLAGADLIACEDTRVTRKLLDRYAIATPLTPYHEHNAAKARPMLLRRLAEGAAIALVSDAGTPLISDPGFKLVRAVQEAGHTVTALPGASAVLAALAVAGLPTDQFFFAGFLPPKEAARRARIAELARIPATLVLFETGPRLAATLADLAAGLGGSARPHCAASSPSCTRKSGAAISQRWRRLAPTTSRAARSFWSSRRRKRRSRSSAAEAEILLRQALARVSLKDAVGEVADATGLPRREVYQRALALAKEAETKARTRPGRNMARRAEPLSRSNPRRGRSAWRRSGSACRRKAARRCFSSPKPIGSWRGAGKRRSARSTSSRAAATRWSSSKSRRARRSTTAVEAVTERSKRRIVAAAELWLAHHPDDGRARNPLRRHRGRARQNTAAHRQCLRCQPLISRVARHSVSPKQSASCNRPTRSPEHGLNVAVQMDPIERINIRGDSTFALLLEAQARGHPLSYYTPDRLALRDGKVSAERAGRSRVRDSAGDHFTLGEPRHARSRRSTSCCCGRIRRSTSPISPRPICSSASSRRRWSSTIPAHVRNAPEKIFVTEFPDLMPPTLVTRDLDAIKAFRAEHGDIVMKPLYGKGGEAVFRLQREDSISARSTTCSRRHSASRGWCRNSCRR